MSRVVSNKLKTAADDSAAAGIAERQSQAAAILRDLERWSQTQIATVPEKNRVLVSKHKAFGFLANRYGIRELPVMDAYAPGGALRPSSLGQISSAIKASGTKAIFAESLPPSKTLRRISRSSGIPIASRPAVSRWPGPGQKPGSNRHNQRLHLRDGPGRSMQSRASRAPVCALGCPVLNLTHVFASTPSSLNHASPIPPTQRRPVQWADCC